MTDLNTLKSQRADLFASGKDTAKIDARITTLMLDAESRATVAQRDAAAQAETARQDFLATVRRTAEQWKDVTAQDATINKKIAEHQAAIVALAARSADLRGNELQPLQGRLYQAMQDAKDHGSTLSEVSAIWQEYQN